MEDRKNKRSKADQFTYFGLIAGGLIGIFIFWLNQGVFALLIPFLGGVLGLISGYLFDKRIEIESKKRLFKNKV